MHKELLFYFCMCNYVFIGFYKTSKEVQLRKIPPYEFKVAMYVAMYHTINSY